MDIGGHHKVIDRKCFLIVCFGGVIKNRIGNTFPFSFYPSLFISLMSKSTWAYMVPREIIVVENDLCEFITIMRV